MTGRQAALATLLVWVSMTVLTLALYQPRIAALTFADPDDYLRLLQVRDWLDGQGWRDVAQHRINPDASAPMHWSRLVDLPIAGVIALSEPFAGREGAARLAGVVVPALSLGVIMAQVAMITGRLVGVAWAPLGAAIAALSSLVHQQTAPMRVDHHAWQIIAALLALQALLDDRRPLRSGAAAGAACALWIHVSVEGAPMTAAMGALLGLRWAVAPTEFGRLASFAVALFAASVALAMVNGGLPALVATHCDQVSAPYLVALGALAALSAVAALRREALARVGAVARVGLGAAAVAAAGAAYLAVGPRCIAGPMDMIDPLLRENWLDRVAESMSAFERTTAYAIVELLPISVGVAGAVAALAGAATARERRSWTTALWLTATALLLSVFVIRAAGVAQAFAAPGAAFVGAAPLLRARRLERAALRVPATIAALIVATPLGASFLAAAFVAPGASRGDTVLPEDACFDGAAWAALRRADPSRLLGALDISPRILFESPHSVLATGHHRNAPAMSDAVRALRGPETVAREVMARHGLTYVAFCPYAAETKVIARVAPDGFLASLLRDAAPDWLEPLASVGPREMRVYRLRGALTPPKHEARAAAD